MQIVERLVKEGHAVIAHNRSLEPMQTAAAFGADPAPTKSEALEHFRQESPIVWLMLPAEIVEGQMQEWLNILPKNSIIIDGGNSDYRQTKKHTQMAQKQNVRFVDIGTSGGVLGLKHGFSMMAGGDKEAFQQIEPILQSLSKPSGSYHYFGDHGAGHYVKMVHNAIEYGMMESLAEGYRMLREGAYKNIDLAAAGNVWQQGSIIASSLNQLTTEALHENPELTGIEGYVAESGETRWTLEAAKEKSIQLPAIQAAFNVRLESQKGNTNFATKLLAAMRNKFGGHSLNKET